MAEASKDNDQSMEDILQSIKRIIADDTEETPPPAAAGSDVLELTELLAEDVAVPDVAEPAPPVTSMSIDEIMAAPISSAPQQPMAEPEPVVVPQPAPPAAEDSLMSDTTLAASMAALDALKHKPAAPIHSHASPSFRSGTTVEDLVIESLKPMLKDWLDGNLPSMVKSLVEREIRRISGL